MLDRQIVNPSQVSLPFNVSMLPAAMADTIPAPPRVGKRTTALRGTPPHWKTGPTAATVGLCGCPAEIWMRGGGTPVAGWPATKSFGWLMIDDTW